MGRAGLRAGALRLARFQRGLRRRGWRGLAVLATTEVADWAFDARYGTHTIGEATLESMTGVVGDMEHAEPYQGTRVLALRGLLRALQLPPGNVLVDFGCGKGRVLMVAAPFGFRAARGVEFSGGLCDVARLNMERFGRRSGTTAEFEIIHDDAGAYPIRDDENVFFFCNPFDDHIMRRVMANIAQSYDKLPRPMMIIYRRPAHQECITSGTPFVKRAEYVFWRSDFAIFEAGGTLQEGGSSPS
jgi:SAM-dependent methyltransferase